MKKSIRVNGHSDNGRMDEVWCRFYTCECGGDIAKDYKFCPTCGIELVWYNTEPKPEPEPIGPVNEIECSRLKDCIEAWYKNVTK